MYPGIENILYRYGYRAISLNVSGLAMFLKQQDQNGLVVVTIDETTGLFLGREQFEHISQTFREFLRDRNCSYAVFLYILISEDDSSAGRLFEDYENYWRIIPSANKLLVYESGARQFEELRPPLERQFPGETFYGQPGNYQTWNYQAGNYQTGNYQTGNYQSGNYQNGNVPTRNFLSKSFDRFPMVNICIIALNVLIFLVTDLFFFQDDRVVEWGALNWYHVKNSGEWYRLLTAMFLHDGPQHIFNNMLVLAYIGACVEQQLGKLRYGILYFAAGVLAGFTSMVYNMNLGNPVYSLGASGAVFGVMGALLFLVLFGRKYAAGYSIRQMMIMVMFSLYGGIASQGVDNAAHIGGFIAGFFLAAILSITQSGTSSEKCK